MDVDIEINETTCLLPPFDFGAFLNYDKEIRKVLADRED